MSGGFIAFVVGFIVGAILTVGAAYAGHAAPPANLGASAVSVGVITGGSFGGLYFVIMFVGRLFEAKPATNR
jgi:hypothetical protein